MLVRSKSLESAITSGRLIRESISVLSVSERVFENSWELFKNQKTTKFSFTDCTILALISENHMIDLPLLTKNSRETVSTK